MRRCSKCGKTGHYRPTCSKKNTRKTPTRRKTTRRPPKTTTPTGKIEIIPIKEWLKQAKGPASRYSYCSFYRIYDGEELPCADDSVYAVLKRENGKTFAVGVCRRHLSYGKKVINSAHRRKKK